MSTHQDCRMYEQKFPEVDDVVMVQVRLLAVLPPSARQQLSGA
jgi:hypothetical protein